MIGWIKLHRKLQDNKLWTCESFTRGQAWVDLLLLANHEYGYFFVRDHKIEVQRGQVGWSENKLAERWKWSRSKVRNFLKQLEKEQQVIQQKSRSYSIIEIVNYEIYQEKEQQQDNSKTTEKQEKDNRKTQTRRIKNNKEGKEDLIKSNIELYKKWQSETENDNYRFFVDYILKLNHTGEPLKYCLQLKGQINEQSFNRLYEIMKKNGTKITDKIIKLEERLLATNGKSAKDLNLTLGNWLQNKFTK